MIPADFDSKFASVAETMNEEALKALIDLRASPQEEERLEYLGDRATEGLLTTEERQEYQSCIMFANFLGILQSKARKKLQAAA
ncbi:MAG: hypothetical protein ACKVY0_23150 [Prosthecobacter sp.]|uniref:hypothetical protein n=1 Tax=Prosthecobacter sp. TaxID=1965333 RepID=UPI0038FDD2A2